MTPTQLLMMTAAIYIAPHVPKGVALSIGSVMMIGAATIGLEWIK